MASGRHVTPIIAASAPCSCSRISFLSTRVRDPRRSLLPERPRELQCSWRCRSSPLRPSFLRQHFNVTRPPLVPTRSFGIQLRSALFARNALWSGRNPYPPSVVSWARKANTRARPMLASDACADFEGRRRGRIPRQHGRADPRHVAAALFSPVTPSGAADVHIYATHKRTGCSPSDVPSEHRRFL